MIAKMMTSLGWFSLPLAIPLEMVWIAFSLFIGSIKHLSLSLCQWFI
ncbi:hypothetical protein LOS20_15970 [Enterococcus faecium]|nr:hypothetical protein [Enterococcus faecium]